MSAKSSVDMEKDKRENRVAFVSLGPGDKDLVTIAALEALRGAKVIYCPSVEDRQGVRRSRAAGLIEALGVDPGKIACFDLAMRTDRTAAWNAYGELLEQVRSDYAAGRQVAVAVEGDVSIYASIHYVLEQLQEKGVPVRQVAGIPSFIAAAATANLSLISQGEKLLVVPGQATAEEMDRWLDEGCTLVIMKLSRLAERLGGYMLSRPGNRYYYLENVATPAAVCLTDVEAILAREIPYFSLLIVTRRS